MKNPDGVSYSIRAAVEASLIGFLQGQEKSDLVDERTDAAYEAERKWLRHSEYLTVELDTETDTCTVVRPT